MSIRLYKSYTPGTRNRALSSFEEITTSKPERTLIRKNHRNKGRNNRGVITIRHRGGGHKKKYRLIDFSRNKHNVEAKVEFSIFVDDLIPIVLTIWETHYHNQFESRCNYLLISSSPVL